MERLLTGPDKISCEILRLGETGVKIMADSFNNIYETGIITIDWLKLSVVILQKQEQENVVIIF